MEDERKKSSEQQLNVREYEGEILQRLLGVEEVPCLEQINETATDWEKKAFQLANEGHALVKRRDGSKYITHPVAVWWIMKRLKINDPEVMAAALMHDVIEDVPDGEQKIVEAGFSERTLSLVKGVSELKDVDKVKENKLTEDKLMEGSGLDYAVALIKIVDRMHNLLTLEAMPVEKRLAKAEQTLKFTTKLARAFKMWDLEMALADLAFRYMPNATSEILKIKNDPRLGSDFVKERVNEAEGVVLKHRISGKVTSIFGGYWRCYQSSLRKEVGYARVNDVMTVEVDVENKEDCYLLEHYLHEKYKNDFIQDESQDYLCRPTFDGYGALQMTCRTDYGWVKYVITTKQNNEYNHRGVLSLDDPRTSEKRAKLVRGKMDLAIVPIEGTVLDAAVALYGDDVRRATALFVDGERVKPSDAVVHGKTLVIETGNEGASWSRFDRAKCSPATRDILEKKGKEEDRIEMISEGKRMLDMVLQEMKLGLMEFDDLVYLDVKIYENIINVLVGDGGTRDGFYIALKREAITPEKVVALVEESGLTKEKIGLSTLQIEVFDRPMAMYEMLTVMYDAETIPDIVRMVGGGSKEMGRAVLKFIIKGTNSQYWEKILPRIQGRGIGMAKVF